MPRSKNPNRIKIATFKSSTLRTVDTGIGSRMKPNKEGNRQYATNSATWRRIREQVLVRDRYTCCDCEAICGAPGDAHVDHVDGNAWNNEPENLITRCASCHSKKTAGRDGGFGNPIR